jgi:hypothetical protein
MPGLPLGLRNNNPGNLRPLSGGQKWQGEIESLNNFSRFKDVAYGLRAMITDITGDIVKDGKNTLRKLITVYAPPGENDTNAYIASVSRLTGLQPDEQITPSAYWITKIIRAKMQVELGANYSAMILTSDINEGFDRLSDQVKVWLNYVRPSSGNAFFYALIAGAGIAYLLRR